MCASIIEKVWATLTLLSIPLNLLTARCGRHQGVLVLGTHLDETAPLFLQEQALDFR
jgi:hypothetical protein